ncbi:ADP-ribose pyrophosphatase [Candidatus Regiella insecticola LSR1]|uniref:ADP-ribose pyrophosphatase n=2 Tax=Candidatus Regiella insecticola TaxID=138073 RepID=E0WS80_9ENTR|nr:ADP-ribose pyrophosphatase [Candidatus Regiella insecticola LSR1]
MFLLKMKINIISYRKKIMTLYPQDGQSSPVNFKKKDVEITGCKTLYKGFFTLKSYQLRHKLFDNKGMSNEIIREVLIRDHAVGLLPYDPLLDQVVLIEQLRIGAIGANENNSPWLLEIIAGMIKTGENPEEVARREAREEAGIELKRCRPMLRYLASPGGMNERLSIMVGEVDATTAKGVHGLLEENENIRVHVVSREQAYRWVEEGVIDNAASIIALQWLALHFQALKEEWK